MAISTTPAALDPSVLPASSSPDLVVVPVTPAEYEHTWLLNADEWKGPLSLSQYLDRERFLIEQDLTRDEGITGWILTSTKLPRNPDGTRPILSSCETILKSAYLARNGSLKKVQAHGICSVYTRPEYRGRGYAGRMMAELGKHVETYQQQNGNRGTFSVLFSDIGENFYAKYGWTAHPSTHIDLSPLDRMKYQSAKVKFDDVQDITRSELADLSLTSYLEEQLKTASKQSPNTPCIAIQPDMEHFDWHHAREEVQAELIGLPFPLVKGAIHRATGIAIVWSRVLATNPADWSLHVLHLAIPPQLRQNPSDQVRNAISALLLRAQHEAHVWNMAAGVQVWDPTELVVSAAQTLRAAEKGNVEVIRRDKDHICSLRFVGADTSNDINWINMEKYVWC